MNTSHNILFADSRKLGNIDDNAIDLVVTSPPYPMIEMWDELFNALNPKIGKYIKASEGKKSFELMHLELDKVWMELDRVVKPSGFVCINIGDATRTIGKRFRLYSNHARIIRALTKLSFDTLPMILWQKTTNAPNKFMGSGMLPAGAYVTLEHEYILIFRKGEKRSFNTDLLKKKRNESAIFWEERNKWFSDFWDLKGERQALNHKKLRARSAAYPFELSYRLINMFSVKGGTVLDPFLGTGTTIFSAIAAGRNSIGVEYDNSFKELVFSDLREIQNRANKRISDRLNDHQEFENNYQSTKRNLKYNNSNHGFKVMTRQEREMKIEYVNSITFDGNMRVLVNMKK